jgi:O-antigen ligase
LSFKRSAFIYLALALCVLVYFDFIKNTKNNMLLRCFYLIILGLGLYFLVDYIITLTDGFILTRLESIQDDGGSGRTVIYERMLNIYSDNSLFEQIFGVGFDKAKILYSHSHGAQYSAHNDFIEMLLDFGIIGLSIYLVIILDIYFLIKRSIILGENYYQANIVAFLCFLVMSMVSHLFLYPTYFAYLMILWAVTEGLLYKTEFIEGANLTNTET